MAKTIKLSTIKPNQDNPRGIKVDQLGKLKKSITEFKKMMSLRPIVVDENNRVLGGNMRLQALTELGYKEIPQAWVKKALDLSDEEKRRFIIADNVSFGEWDVLELEKAWDVTELADWGIEFGSLFDQPESEPEKSPYSAVIKSPVYEVNGEKPTFAEMYNTGKAEALLAEIEQVEAPEDVKMFLRAAAARHVVFHFQNIAEFYAHSSAPVQRLMENSALVIIDFNRAIENGFVRMTNDLVESQKEQEDEG
ncbi:MAG: ParB N-terminal domain-containing protein [Notoacmeibacter sp.]